MPTNVYNTPCYKCDNVMFSNVCVSTCVDEKVISKYKSFFLTIKNKKNFNFHFSLFNNIAR